MKGASAMQGDFVDLRFVKGRKVCQVVIEIPIEAGAAFVAAFGTPNPAISVPVAIARIDLNAKAESAETSVKTPRRWNEISKSQQAGILCGEGAFRKYLNETRNYNCETTDDCKQAIYEICNISSRADLNQNKVAADLFDDLESGYRAWFLVAA